MSHVAGAVGIANAAVYWYFPSKDDLLAEVFRRAVVDEVARLKDSAGDPFSSLIKGLVDLRPYRQIHMSIHERMSESPALTDAHDQLISWIREMVVAGLEYHGRDAEAEADLVELVVVLFEGSNVPGVRGRTATDVIQIMIDRLILPRSVDCPRPAARPPVG